MKKALSLLLSLVIALTVIAPGFMGLDFATIEAEAASTGAGDAYATLFTMSDLQANGYMQKVKQMISHAREDGITETPDALLFGGDFQTTSNYEESISHHIDAIERLFNDFYPYYHSDNLVFIKGNHDLADERHHETGLHEFDNFFVYVINEADYRAGSLEDAQTASENLQLALDRLLATGNDKPVFVMTHVPFHHNSRGNKLKNADGNDILDENGNPKYDYSQSKYGRYLFNVLNTYGNFMDIVFMFGHNHSGNYDDYIGGSVNFLGVGDTIYISEYGLENADGTISENYGEKAFTAETLNFTYMNYGYAAYNNNTNGLVYDIHTEKYVQSTNVNNMGVIEICPDRIVVSRYTPGDDKDGGAGGKYGDSKIITRKTPANADGSYDEPYVRVAHYPDDLAGIQYGAYANATGFENPVYTWSSSNSAVASVAGNGPVAHVTYLTPGTTTITVTVSEADGSVTKTDSYSLKVTGPAAQKSGAGVLMGESNVTGKTLEYYNTNLPYQLYLIGHYSGATTVSGGSWESSDETVATVTDGLVKFVGNGPVTITYTVTVNNQEIKSTVDFIVSNGDKQVLSDEIVGYTDKYYQSNSLVPGNRYIILAKVNADGNAVSPNKMLSGTKNGGDENSDGKAQLLGVDATPATDSNGEYIETTNGLAIWECLKSDRADAYYLRNLQTQEYLVLSCKFVDGTSRVRTITTAALGDSRFLVEAYQIRYIPGSKNTVRSIAQGSGMTADGKSEYLRYNNNFVSSTSANHFDLYQAETILAAPESEAHIEMGADYVENTSQTVYDVTAGMKIQLYGTHKNYGPNVKEGWASSNLDVATISTDGMVTFTGTAGTTTITYKTKSDSVDDKSLTFTLTAKTGSERTRTFKLVEKMVADRPYVLVYKSDITAGEGFALSTNTLTQKAMFPEDIEVKYNQIEDYLYVEIPESEEDNFVWATGGDKTKDFFYITTERSILYRWGTTSNYTETEEFLQGAGECVGITNDLPTTEYLGVEVTSYGEWGVEGSLYTGLFGIIYPEILAGKRSMNPHTFHYVNRNLYSEHVADVTYSKDASKNYNGYSAVDYHDSGYFGVGENEKSMLLAFEEVFPDPTAVIESNYEYIGKNVTRDEVCPGQVEQLTGVAENFPDGKKTYDWLSSDTSVATIDSNGKLTYTGKAGFTTITLTITNTSDVAENNVSDTQTITITVNPSQIETGDEEDGNRYYLITDNFVPDNEYVLAHTNDNYSDAAKIDGLTYAISKSRYSNNLAKGEVTTITDGVPKYIENPATTTVWKAVESGVDGYVYLVDEDGWYLSIYYDSGNEDVVRSFPSTEGQTSNGGTAIPADSFLIKTDGTYLYSKQSGTGGVKFDYGSTATSTKRFTASGTKAEFEIFEKANVSIDYYLTDKFVDGRKYIIANVAVEGSTYIASSKLYTNNVTPRLVTEKVENHNNRLVIRNPANALVLTAVQENNGYFYLVDENGNYLIGYTDMLYDANGEKVSDRQTTLVVLGDRDQYDRKFSQFRYRITDSHNVRVIQTAGEATTYDDGSKLYNNGYLAFYYSGTSNPRLSVSPWSPESGDLYLYELEEKEDTDTDTTPVTQIRVNGREGVSKDITNTTNNRYNIQSGDTEMLLRYVANVEKGYEYKWASSDTSIATIDENTGVVTYTGEEGYASISLTVTGTAADGSDYSETVRTTIRTFKGGFELEGDDYPEYPYEGSVRVNKTASNAIGSQSFTETGVTEIELAATGVPVARPIDVVVVFDHSTSMNDGNKLQDAMDKTRRFALHVLDTNPNNRVAIVTFDSLGSRYSAIDSTVVVDSLVEKEAGIITGNRTVENAFFGVGQEDELVEAVDSLITNNQANTNYDYGLKKAYDILSYAKNEENSPNDRIVVFMSDGSPGQFNGLQLDFSNGSPNLPISEAWLTGNEDDLAPYLADLTKYPAAALFNPNADNWYAQALKAPDGAPANLPAFDYYSAYQTGLGAKLFTIGYKTDDKYGALERMASTPANYFNDIGSDLQTVFDKISSQVFYAATNAVVTDKLGANFNAQFATSFAGVNNSTIELGTDPSFEIGYWTLDNVGNRVDYNVMETITFTTDDNGVLTGAISSVTGSCYDVAASTINGQYVSYNLNTETFTWNIGDINRNEVTLKYYAYLEGAAKGEREAGIYETNETATLSYTNYKGTANCSKYFPVPSLAWKLAAVNYEFYLVNEQGQPIGLNGMVVPFAERVIIGREQTKQLLVSASEEQYTLTALEELPDGYELYNENAAYSVKYSATGLDGSATISDTTLTTYFRDGSRAVNVNGEVKDVYSYINTSVSFAVKASQGVIPDSVVIDYGLPVRIQVLGNDYVVDGGTITGVSGAVANGTKFNNHGYESSQLVNAELKYGTAEIKHDGVDLGYWYPDYVVYTPTTTDMPEEEVFYYEYKADGQYYYAKVTVIPAANIYYEESFMTFVDGKEDKYKWEDVGTAITGKFQAEDRPGTFAFDDFDKNNAYGYDEAYNDSFTYSLGSAKKTSVDNKAFGKEASATFTFCGTGFDLYSVTNNDTGAIMVSIMDSSNNTKNYLVNTYYGYTLDDEGALEPDADNGNAIYQVPVISKRDLEYGTYDVTIKPMYSSAFDPNYDKEAKYGDYSIYVDSVRIFNPAGVDADDDDTVISSNTIRDAYLADGEYDPVFQEIRKTLLSAEEFDKEAVESLGMDFSGSIFLDGIAEDGVVSLSTYKEQGPNNELYLGKNQAVAFMVSSESYAALASLQLGMKVVSGNETAQVVVMNTSEKNPTTIEISSAHETFRKLNSAIIWNQENINYGDTADINYETLYPIVIANVSDTVVSLTTFKWAHTIRPEGTTGSPLNITVNSETPMLATMALRNAVMAIEEPVETETYDVADVSIEWADQTFTQGKEATLKVTTPPEVVKVTVADIEVTDCEIDENGNKLWTYTFIVKQAGENAYDVVLYDYNGDASEPVKTETIYVEEAKDEPTTDEPTTDEPTTDEPTTDEPATDDSFFDKLNQKAQDIIKAILAFLEKLITFIWRLFA